VRGCREPKQLKRDFVSNDWHRWCNQCGRLVEEASVNSTKDSLDMREISVGIFIREIGHIW
jgi:hypothetical protein